MKLVAFCEALSDFQTATGLVDRVLREDGPDWVDDTIEQFPDAVRVWARNESQDFFDIHKLDRCRTLLGNQRVPQGRFGGEKGAPGATMARTIFTLVRRMNKQAAEDQVDAVVIVWDMDDQGEGRRKGLDQARQEARTWAPFQILLACPDPKREAWVLAGFDPKDDHERDRLDDLRKELGFSPVEQAHRLRDKEEQATRNPKRVLRILTSHDRLREERCWSETPLAVLRDRGGASGLTAFLTEVQEQLVPVVSRRRAAR